MKEPDQFRLGNPGLVLTGRVDKEQRLPATRPPPVSGGRRASIPSSRWNLWEKRIGPDSRSGPVLGRDVTTVSGGGSNLFQTYRAPLVITNPYRASPSGGRCRPAHHRPTLDVTRHQSLVGPAVAKKPLPLDDSASRSVLGRFARVAVIMRSLSEPGVSQVPVRDVTNRPSGQYRPSLDSTERHQISREVGNAPSSQRT
jgi:hypothetical protein